MDTDNIKRESYESFNIWRSKIDNMEINTYAEYAAFAKTVRWKVDACGTGDDCWCRVINLESGLPDGEYDSGIVSSGSIDKHLAEYIVELHNKRLNSTM